MGVDSPPKSQGTETMSQVPGRNTANGHRESDSENKLPAIQPPANQEQRTAAGSGGLQETSSEPCTPLANRRSNRPLSSPPHRLSGQLLRTMGDQYLCRSTGKTLQVLGDGLEREYLIRKALSTSELQRLQDSDDDDNAP